MAIEGYREFVLSVEDAKIDERGTTHFEVEVIDSPVGRGPVESSQVPVELHRKIRQLERRNLALEEMIQLGEDLADCLLPPAARTCFLQSRERLAPDQGLRLRLRLHHALAALPWEILYIPGDSPAKDATGFLALDPGISIVRQDPSLPFRDRSLYPAHPRLLAAFSSPRHEGYPSLDIEAEKEIIERAVAGPAGVSARFLLKATRQELQDQLRGGAEIFHFGGHGAFALSLGQNPFLYVGEGLLVAETADRQPDLWPARAIASAFRDQGIQLAVLNAQESAKRDLENPWSSVAAALLQAGIPAVVAFQHIVPDRFAIALSRSFYETLANGASLDEAVFASRIAILTEANRESGRLPEDLFLRDWAAPVLYMQAPEFSLQFGIGVPPPARREISAEPFAPILDRITEEAQPLEQPAPTATLYRHRLRKLIERTYDESDLDLLMADVEFNLAKDSFELILNLDIVGGDSLPNQILNLVRYLEKRGFLEYLEKTVREQRPGLFKEAQNVE